MEFCCTYFVLDIVDGMIIGICLICPGAWCDREREGIVDKHVPQCLGTTEQAEGSSV